MADKVYWINERPVMIGPKTEAIGTVVTGLFVLIFSSVAAAIPLALALGIGYALSWLTSIPLAIAIALALGSMFILVLFAAGKKITGALHAIRDRMPDSADSEYGGGEEEDE